MASTEKPDWPEAGKREAPPSAGAPRGRVECFALDVALRVLLFAASLTAIVVMVTAKQTKLIPVAGLPPPSLFPVKAKFNDSPAFIYFVAALSVACLHSIITTITSLAQIAKPTHATKRLLHYAISDALILGIVAAATGAAGGVAYIGLKGNNHVGWNKICNLYDTFCKHIGSSVALSLFASILLLLLVILSVLSLHKRISSC